MKAVAFWAAILATTVGAAGQARSADDRETAVRMVSAATVLIVECGRLSFDNAVLSREMKRRGIAKEDLAPGGRDHALASRHVSDMKAVGELSGRTGEKSCGLALSLYGPNGSVMRGLVVSR